MENNTELVRLEQFVDNLLNKYNNLKNSFHALEGTLRERDDECSALKEEIAGLTSQRTEVGSRVSGLLGRIEQWESEQDETAQADDEEEQDSLFESDDEENR